MKTTKSKQKAKAILCFVFCILCTVTAIAQDKRAKIKDYLNQEIFVVDNFAGQSITLVKENNDYFILRKYFGSGVPVIDSVKYKVEFNSDYQIAFSEVIDASKVDLMKSDEKFILGVEDNGLGMYLNGLKIVIIEHYSTTDVANINVDKLNVYAYEGTVIVSNVSAGQDILIYNSLGQLIASKVSVEGTNTVAVAAKGVTIVKVGTKTGTVIL